MRFRIQRIDPWSVAKIFMALGAIIGAASGLMGAVVFALRGPGGPKLGETLWAALTTMVRGVSVGLAAGVAALIYNGMAWWTGGIELELARVDEPPSIHHDQAGGPKPLPPPSQTPEQ